MAKPTQQDKDAASSCIVTGDHAHCLLVDDKATEERIAQAIAEARAEGFEAGKAALAQSLIKAIHEPKSLPRLPPTTAYDPADFEEE